MSKFFIERPIFAWVIAIIMMLAGIVSLFQLPINQYPNIAPPNVSINTFYPGASAQDVQNSVVQVIEQQLTGIDGLRYISSSSNSDGSMSINVTFEQGTDENLAQVQVQNKIQQAMSLLPTEVQQQGVSVQKATSTFLMLVALISNSDKYNIFDLNDYLITNIQDPISRTSGVGSVQVFGNPYAMRIWLDPAKLYQYKLTALDVRDAIRSQNIQVSFGQLGDQPAVKGQQLNAAVIGKGRFSTVEEFENILLRTSEDGARVKLSDVSKVELGAQGYGFDARYMGQPAGGIVISATPSANALITANNVAQTLEKLRPFLPEGLELITSYDTTPVVSESVNGVVQTLVEAILLVFVVMFLFLQDWRATLIPTLAIPVVLLGTFAILLLAGFTINTLTMFAMVLAIGLLVDDAIVVVENVERIMHEEGLPPIEATKKSMSQIQGALFGIAVVLSAVFLPMAFFPGSTGIIYRQFSITIVTSMALSVVVALIFTPALCASFLQPIEAGSKHEKSGFFGAFNRFFNRTANGYRSSVSHVLGNKLIYSLLYVALIAVAVLVFLRIPSSFLPDEDQGVMFLLVQTPENSTLEHTAGVLQQTTEKIMANDAHNIKSIFTVAGFSFAGRGQNAGMGFMMLKPWNERKDLKTQHVKAIQGRTFMSLQSLSGGTVYPIVPPPIMSLGNATGFEFYLQDASGNGILALQQSVGALMAATSQSKIVTEVRPNMLSNVSQYKLTVDEERARMLGIDPPSVYSSLAVAWGGSYINDFIDKGKIKRVYLQSNAESRMNPEDIGKWYARNNRGEMVSFSAFTNGQWLYGPPTLVRYNSIQAVNIQGKAAPGYSTGEAMAEMEEIVRNLPNGVGLSWTGLSYEEIQAGNMQTYLYIFSILIVFLCLAALYESWSVPFAVLFTVPLGIIGACLATWFIGLQKDVFFQIGMLTTMGLTARNAILIVEFARELHDSGVQIVDAAIEACRMRLRPIVMTSFAFIFGVAPLVVASGASASSKLAIGISVMGGMISALLLAIFWIPMFYVMFANVSDMFGGKTHKTAVEHAEEKTN